MRRLPTAHRGGAGQRVFRFAPGDLVRADLSQRLGLLREFGDAELAALVAPRALIVEYSRVPDITSTRGDLKTPKFESVRTEFDRIETLSKPGFQKRNW